MSWEGEGKRVFHSTKKKKRKKILLQLSNLPMSLSILYPDNNVVKEC